MAVCTREENDALQLHLVQGMNLPSGMVVEEEPGTMHRIHCNVSVLC